MRTWLDIEQRFRDIVTPLQHIRLDHTWGAAGDSWRLAGMSNTSLSRQYETLASIAGKALKRSLTPESKEGKIVLKERDPKVMWYRAVKELGGEFKSGFYAEQQDSSGNSAGIIFTGSVDNIVEASANLCLMLESSYPIKDDRTIRQKLYDDYGRKIVIGTIIAIITAIIVTFFLHPLLDNYSNRPKVTISLQRIDYGTLQWPENPNEYSYVLLELEVTNEEENPIPLPPHPFQVSVKINHKWVSFEKMPIPLSGTVLYATEKYERGANIDHIDLQKYRELNVSRLYGHYLPTIRKKDQYLNSKHYLLSLSTVVSHSQLEKAFNNFKHDEDIPIKISWQDIRGIFHESYLVVHKAPQITSGCYKVYAKTVKYFKEL